MFRQPLGLPDESGLWIAAFPLDRRLTRKYFATRGPPMADAVYFLAYVSVHEIGERLGKG